MRSARASPQVARWVALILTLLPGLGCRTAAPLQPRSVTARDDGIVLFGKAASETAAFFQQTRCLVGRVRLLEETSDGTNAVIIYPSGNYGHSGMRTTVVYSHRVRIVEHEHHEANLQNIDLERQAVILAATDEASRVHQLVGLLPLPSDGSDAWDYFRDRPELWYRGGPR